MSRRARKFESERRELERIYEAQAGADWREDRDRDDEDIPEPDDDEPVNTFH